LVLASFHGGMRRPAPVEWALALSVYGLVAAVLVVVGRHGSPAKRAGCLGAAAAVVWSVDASFVKQLTDTLQLHGFLGAFDHCPLYALVASGILGAVLTRPHLAPDHFPGDQNTDGARANANGTMPQGQARRIMH
jgi:hypothetical protein